MQQRIAQQLALIAQYLVAEDFDGTSRQINTETEIVQKDLVKKRHETISFLRSKGMRRGDERGGGGEEEGAEEAVDQVRLNLWKRLTEEDKKLCRKNQWQ